ncbi:hypothetical protein G9A89_002673 [Geosiphon pyriformis]|nr:hypothetical protein G9A89_002673 [Geosiphon pyriformis]
MSNKRKITESEASTSSADSTIEIKRRKTEDSIIPDVSTSDASNSSINDLKTELTHGKVDFGLEDLDIGGESAQDNVGKEEVETPSQDVTPNKEEIETWAPQQINKFLKKKSKELFLREKDLNIIKDNWIAGQDFLLLTKEELMRYGLKGGPATRIAFLVEKLKVEKQAIQTILDFRYDPKEYIAVEKAFSDSEYCDPHGVVKSFCEHVDKNMMQWDSKEYYSPYCALIQASAFGKSRLMVEIGKFLPVSYVCLRKEYSNGYPPRCPIADILTGKKKLNYTTELIADMGKVYVAYFCAVFDLINDFFNDMNAEGLAERWIQKQISKESSQDFWSAVEVKMREIILQLPSGTKNPNEPTYITELGAFVSQYWNLTRLCLERLWRIDDYEVKSRYLFVFDEARILNEKIEQTWSNFEWLRYAMMTLPEQYHNGRVFCVFLDTTSKISNFSPPNHLDPSFRVHQKGRKLFPPFVEVAFVDLPAERLPQSLAESSLPQHFFKFGRPLWTALHRSGNLRSAAVISIATSKLIGGMDYNSWLDKKKNGERISDLECLGILGPRLCLDIVPQCELAPTLTASYMRPCFYINDARTTIMTGCISEATLAEASAHVTSESQGVGLVRVLEPLINMMKEGLVEGGYRGEVVARLILLHAWDRACDALPSLINEESSNWFSRPMPLVSYLKYLLNYKVYCDVICKMDEDDIKKKLLKAYIRFNHFVAITYTPRPRHILEALKRGTAFVCKRNQQGTDLIIPLVMNIGIHGHMSLENISYVLVSVKNYQKSADNNYFNNATSMNSPSNVRIEQLPTLPFLSLYMQFGKVAGVDEEYNIPQVGTLSRTTESNMKEIQRREKNEGFSGSLPRKRKCESNSEDSEVNNSDEHAYRLSYQFAIGLFGLTAYGFLQENDSGNQLLNTVRQLLVAWRDPVDCQTDEKKRFLVQQMQPMVYTSEEAAISSRSQSRSQSTTPSVKTGVHPETRETESSLTTASFDSREQKLIPNQQKFEADIAQAIEACKMFQEKAAKANVVA